MQKLTYREILTMTIDGAIAYALLYVVAIGAAAGIMFTLRLVKLI
ncbi:MULTISPECIES: cytochrome b6-f complex subunit PetL [Oscillatoriales]|uniref:Uncharacterized protein n=3 Tax=Limnospira TaxID=2596745 RepID=A0A9P1NZU7_9CYAN|nr:MULTISPECIES: hypothetical protein [Oscillatoriales]EDZ91906.1 hypothetical protein AmaxDRAFT_5351 [Limnospira maxima CS-328]EKD07499.1 hypothetical protein SPLC1_S411660 [Arthrospira platensis C1]MDC0837448.1 hypothetical protein [Limnoraphis robusta]MDT9181881.1 hypothetical protein [Limnospira sp. PMC 289.06]MDT9187581.1 hypothetical protein [Limnospira sp. PMC 894.15]MDT9265061.1 hypothetical protein [Limnospira sp. PMC 1223.20]MDT9273043.1 hypothetical protein [Limnospira sp. PMC 737